MNSIKRIIPDVNPTEIRSHIEDGTLEMWCKSWQKEANSLADLPADVTVASVLGLFGKDGDFLVSLIDEAGEEIFRGYAKEVSEDQKKLVVERIANPLFVVLPTKLNIFVKA